MKFQIILTIATILNIQLLAQDTTKYQWPVKYPDGSLTKSKNISGTFCEFRNTLSADHFHNGVDVGEVDGNPVYAGLDGVVAYIDGNSGSNSYVRVRSTINGRHKNITYLHIVPNPALYVGQPVAKGLTILGTIYSGQGHVHMTEREFVDNTSSIGVEINPLRNNGGLTNYTDNYPPTIERTSIFFRINNSSFNLPASGLTGKVDIIIKVNEKNGTTSSSSNNGTYMLGYRILSSDKSTVLYEPPDNGLKYRFDRLPSNTDVHNAFVDELADLSTPYYFLTNGKGANNINSSRSVSDNFFDTALLEDGDYVLEIFTEDTRGNKDTEHFNISINQRDIVPPAVPELLSILNNNNSRGLTSKWQSNQEGDLAGYRLYYTNNSTLNYWKIAGDESLLSLSTNDISFNTGNDFNEPASGDVYYFYLSAVDTVNPANESASSDIYARSSYSVAQNYPSVLIVDGFDRYGGSGSWKSDTHSFVTSYFIALSIADKLIISSASNNAVVDNLLNLNDYDIVFWFTGDETTVTNSLDTEEQQRLSSYLESGGKLFISGSEIGWDLGRVHNTTLPNDSAFFRKYLKSAFEFDGMISMNMVEGLPGTPFENVALNIGQVYSEDYPDDINPVEGSIPILKYNLIRSSGDPRIAGIAYTGKFNNSNETGKLIYIPFSFETIGSPSQRSNFMKAVLNYFQNSTTDITDEQMSSLPKEWHLFQNYPNPFNPTTKFRVSIPANETFSLKIYDILGREVHKIFAGEFEPGIKEFEWNAESFASGIYFVRLRTKNYSQSRSILLLK